MDNNQDYLTGKLLLAMPSVGDPRFHRSVIYMCEHHEQGAMGIVINQEAPGLAFRAVLEQFDMPSEDVVDFAALPSLVLSGGPVNPGQGFLLHSSEFSQKDTLQMDQFFSVTGTIDALKDIAVGRGPESFLFALGYAGWGVGQLEAEIRQNAWLVCDASPALVFDTGLEDKWRESIASLGFDPSMLSSHAGRA